MAEILGHPNVTLTMTIALSEGEARALDAMAGYGDDAFIIAFYEHLGKSYMEKHEDGLRKFLKTIRQFMPGVLSRVDAARKEFIK